MASASIGDSIVETIKTVVYAVLLAGIIRTVLFQPFWIPSGSMKDTLLIGDFLFVNKFAYGYSRYSCPFSWMCPFEGRILAGDPDRGDVVVFTHPVNEQVYIKRLIGLPGDRIQMRDGVLFINDAAAAQTPQPAFVEMMERQGPMGNRPQCLNSPVGEGADCAKERALEALPEGPAHSILNISDSRRYDNTGVYTVPENNFFFVGDNRDNSQDSRVPRNEGGVGFVPFDHLVGRADRIMFSSAGRSILAFWTWRGDRFFKAVN